MAKSTAAAKSDRNDSSDENNNRSGKNSISNRNRRRNRRERLRRSRCSIFFLTMIGRMWMWVIHNPIFRMINFRQFGIRRGVVRPSPFQQQQRRYNHHNSHSNSNNLNTGSSAANPNGSNPSSSNSKNSNVYNKNAKRCPPPNANIITHATNGPPRLTRSNASYFSRPHSATGSYSSGSGSSGTVSNGNRNNRLGAGQGPPRPASAMSKLSSGGATTATSQNGSSSGSAGKQKCPLGNGSGEVYIKRPEREERFRQMVVGSGNEENANENAELTVIIDPAAQLNTERKEAEEDFYKTDTYHQLIDINIHRWIVWMMNHCFLLPHLYMPSLQHFTFGSIHDISYQLQLVEDASVGAAGCSSRDIILHFWKVYVRNNCTSANAIEPLKGFAADQQQKAANNSAVMMVAAGSLEMAASPLVETNNTPSIRSPSSALAVTSLPPPSTQTPSSFTSPSSPFSPSTPPPPYLLPISSVSMAKMSTSVVIDFGGEGINSAKTTKTTTKLTTPSPISEKEMIELKSYGVGSPVVESVAISMNGNDAGGSGPEVSLMRNRLMETAVEVGKQVQAAAAVAGEVAADGDGGEGGAAAAAAAAAGGYDELTISPSTTSSFDIRGWFAVRAWTAFCFFLLVSGRQLVHFSYVLIVEEHRQVSFIWAPLIVNTITTLATAFSALWLIGKKYLMEDQIIASASFLRPLRSFWHLFLRGIPRGYFTLAVAYQVVNLIGVVLVVMQKTGAWEFASPNGTLSNVTKVSGDGEEMKFESVGWNKSELTKQVVAGSVSNWHLLESIWLPSTVAGVATNSSCCQNLAEQANAVIRSREALLPFNQLPWVFWLDLGFRVITNFVLALMKTFWLSLSCFLILKSIHFVVQRDFAIAKGLTRNEENFVVREVRPSVEIEASSSVEAGNGSASTTAPADSRSLKSASPGSRVLTAKEVLETLAQMQLENLRRFYRIFRVPVIIWVFACIVKLVAILEYLYVGGESFAPWSKEIFSMNTEVPASSSSSSSLAELLFRWYECTYFGLSVVVTAADIILPAVVLICTCHYQRVLKS